MFELKAILILLGTCLPLLSFIITAFLAYKFEGQRRWMALILTPILTMAPCYIFAKELANNGNLLFAVTFGLGMILLIVYYPALIIIRIVLAIRNRRQTPRRRVPGDGLTKKIY